MANSKTETMAKLKLWLNKISHFVPVFPKTQCFTIFSSIRARSKDGQLEILGNQNL